MMLRYKRTILSFEILPIGCYIHATPTIDEKISEKFFIYMAGVIGNLFLLIIGFIISYRPFVEINISMILFNLLPILPLDGYHIWSCLLSNFFPYKITQIIMIIIDLVILSSLIFYISFTKNGLILISYLGYFICIVGKEILQRKNHYESFLLRKHLTPNNGLKLKKNNYYDLPLESKFYFGKKNYYRINEELITETEILNKRYGKVKK